jgi:hypothetical protein
MTRLLSEIGEMVREGWVERLTEMWIIKVQERQVDLGQFTLSLLGAMERQRLAEVWAKIEASSK